MESRTASALRLVEPGDKVRPQVLKVMRKLEAACGDKRQHVTIRARPSQGTLGNVRKDVEPVSTQTEAQVLAV